MATKKAKVVKQPAKRREYRAARGAMYDDAMAAELGRVVDQLDGVVKPSQLVDIARDRRSAIHKLFEWDTDVAAEKYRLTQAREHLNHLVIDVVIDGKDCAIRAVHSVSVTLDDDSMERRYMSHDRVSQSSDAAAQVVATALRELKGWRARYGIYKAAYGNVIAAIDELE